MKRFSSPGKVLTLADFTSEDVIVPRLAAKDMAGAILELCEAFQRSDERWDSKKLCHAALEREHQMTTAMAFGAAFPHARSNVCVELQFALGCTAEPIEWGPPGSTKVSLVFLNAVPAHEAMGYLKLLSGMARLGKDPALFESFKKATTARELMHLLEKVILKKG